MNGIDFNKEYNREDFLEFLQDTFLPEDFSEAEEEVYPEFKSKYIEYPYRPVPKSPKLAGGLGSQEHSLNNF
ncbi:MAG: hypothetical protein GY757_41680 [bacterium]|nr:hypothetical protein [bacterium]